jgi:hypothetical protein
MYAEPVLIPSDFSRLVHEVTVTISNAMTAAVAIRGVSSIGIVLSACGALGRAQIRRFARQWYD